MTSLVNKFHISKLLRNSILIGIVLLYWSCGEKPEVHISQTIMFEGKLYKMEAEDPFSGIVFNTYPNGQREYTGEYKDGKPNGLLVYWYEKGVKKREGELKNGVPAGRWTYYNSDGSIKEIKDH